MTKCTHATLKKFTFADGQTIRCCPAMLTTTYPDGKTVTDPCDYQGAMRRAILKGEKPSQDAEFEDMIAELQEINNG